MLRNRCIWRSGRSFVNHTLLTARRRINHKHLFFRTAFEFVFVLGLSTAATEYADQTVCATIAFEVETVPDGFSLHPDGHTRNC